jgi:hypothetical protein
MIKMSNYEKRKKYLDALKSLLKPLLKTHFVAGATGVVGGIKGIVFSVVFMLFWNKIFARSFNIIYREILKVAKEQDYYEEVILLGECATDEEWEEAVDNLS